ncbi:2-oxoacid:acceptor oxidoreductase subunit alpha [Aneurinibacillus danicus]|jgi:2-oxoglutarate ferredoxin oxidoreductase subunit alpha|uniref:Pyruvate ferredoxin oxidoreductase subunit alpha n=3 Tax=Aneurinibacillus TaxID=55079 RepID=A0A511V8I6_9BACL|nr:2-oxoacid:acceptor oxidoreductase subunit alpha [Aneurinibacillus danicus]GEN35247.1 pyruvate ferredoxin oxidoreductase subunit alpha [Aneurinibacillus danicus]
MISQLSWKVGGQQGEGIDSTGEIFAIALNRLGYYLYGYRHFSSRIKGGHTNNKIRVSTKPLGGISDNLDILVAFDQETIDVNSPELRKGGVIIGDSKFNPKAPEGADVRLFSVPFTEIAEELGTSLMKNMVAIGASSALLGLPAESFSEVVDELFGKKGQKVVEKNMEAIARGAEYVNKEAGGPIEELRLEPADGKKRMFMIGNDAIAMGALAAGCRFMPAYPITPASEIMEYLVKKLPEFGGTVIQTEDEIAAVTMAIGANYGGVRTLTASAGPGLSLMAEAIGLAGITETPLVIVDTQRGGPSTGMPTKQEQSDVNAMIYNTHGEIPKVILAPSTAEEAFYDTVEAFNIAEEYQVPVILLTDLQLSLGKQTVEPLDQSRVEIRRGKYLGGQELPELEGEMFKRYEVTEDGISPRVVPGQKHGIHHVTGVEHTDTGRPTEDPVIRVKQMDKRLRKLNNLKVDTPVYKDAPNEEADLLVVAMGGIRGAVTEAKERLEAEGVKVNQAHVRLIHPFPAAEMKELMEKAKKVVVIEHNATGQLTDQIKLHVGMTDKINSVLKYDGNPFLPGEIYNKCKELL